MMKSRFFFDILNISVGTAIGQLGYLCLMPFVTRLYSPADFGIFSFYSALAYFITIFSTFQIEQALLLPKSNRRAHLLLIVNLAIALFSSLFLSLVISCVNLSSYLPSADVWELIGYLPITVFFMSLSKILRVWMIRHSRFTATSLILLCNAAGILLTSIPIASFEPLHSFRKEGLILGQVTGYTINGSILLFITYKHCFKIDFTVAPSLLLITFKKYFSLAAVLSLSHAIKSGSTRLPLIILSRLKQETILGFYGLVERVINIPVSLLSNAIGNVFSQRSAAEYNATGRFDRLLLKTVAGMALVGVPLYLIGSLIAPAAFAFVFGENWREAGEYASIILVGEFFIFTFSTISQGAVLVKAKKFIFCWNLALFFSLLALIPLSHSLELTAKGTLWMITSINAVMYSIEFFTIYHFSKGGMVQKPCF